ncbi:hypothetical protein C8R47DRAFT_424713 [Mycena vitilis]|nr:hypothetical protein C8R47DRAFT_424713 [Mycena vitilis]
MLCGGATQRCRQPRDGAPPGIVLLSFGRRQASTASKRTATSRFVWGSSEAPCSGNGGLETTHRRRASGPSPPVLSQNFGRRQARTVPTRTAPYLKFCNVLGMPEAPRSGADSPETTYRRPASVVPMLNFGCRQARTASQRIATSRFVCNV